MDIAMVKSKQHFIINFRQIVKAPFLTGSRSSNANPITLDVISQPGMFDLDPAQVFRVFVIGYQRRGYSTGLTQSTLRMAGPGAIVHP